MRVALRPTIASEAAAAPPEPGAIPSRPRGAQPLCVRLADDSGWTCTPAASTPEELARLVAEAETAKRGPQAYDLFDVERPAEATTPRVALLQVLAQTVGPDDIGSLLAFVALEGPAGWGLAADAGEHDYGFNGGCDVQLVGARRDTAAGLVVVEASWSCNYDGSPWTEESWYGTEARATVCDPARLSCRTVATSRTSIETRVNANGTVTRRQAQDAFRARLELHPGGAVRLRLQSGRLPRRYRALGRRAAPLAGVVTRIGAFQF
jgi:hypothetical protein